MIFAWPIFLQVHFFVFPKCMSIIFVFINFSSSELPFFYIFNMPEMILSPNFLHFQTFTFLICQKWFCLQIFCISKKLIFQLVEFFISPNMLCLYIFLKMFQYFQVFSFKFFITLFFVLLPLNLCISKKFLKCLYAQECFFYFLILHFLYL